MRLYVGLRRAQPATHRMKAEERTTNDRGSGSNRSMRSIRTTPRHDRAANGSLQNAAGKSDPNAQGASLLVKVSVVISSTGVVKPVNGTSLLVNQLRWTRTFNLALNTRRPPRGYRIIMLFAASRSPSRHIAELTQNHDSPTTGVFHVRFAVPILIVSAAIRRRLTRAVQAAGTLVAAAANRNPHSEKRRQHDHSRRSVLAP
jgi:hypothetical protein